MATYIQGLYDSPLAITPFTPDYSLIQNVLKTKEMEYERGFAQVKNVYNSLLTAKATNAEDQEMQKAYIAQAEEQLKNLATVDLSLDQNVSIANSVFKPFQEDQELLYDISLTKIADQQTALGQSFLNSSDDKQRKMHSAISDEYVRIPLDELKRAKRGDGSITSVRPRYYVPAVNLYDKFKDFLKAGEYDAVMETSNGSGLILKTKGGKRVEMGLYSLMNGLLTGDDRKYFDAWGDVLYNRSINEYMGRGFTLDQSRKELAADFYQRDLRYLTNQRDNLVKDQKLVDLKLAEYQNRSNLQGGLSQRDVDDADLLKMTRLTNENELKDLNSKIRTLADPQKMQSTIQSYYNGKGGVISDRLINDSLKSISSAMGILTESKEYKADEYYWKKMEHAVKIQELEINRMKAQTDLLKAQGESSPTGLNGPKTVKLTEAEKKVIIANTPVEAGVEKTPESKEGQLKTFWDNMNENYNGIVENGILASEELLGSTFNSGNASIGNLLTVIRDKKLNNKFTDEAVELTSTKDTPDGIQKAFKRFKELYVDSPDYIPSGPDDKSEFQTYLKDSGKKDGDKITYGDIYGFLFNKSNKVFADVQSSMSADRFIKVNGYFSNIADGNELAQIFTDDQKKVESSVLTNLENTLKTKRYKGSAIDPNDIIVTDDDGFRRIKSKQELQSQIAELKKDNPIIGYETVRSTERDALGPAIPVYTEIPIYKNQNKLKRLNLILDNIDALQTDVDTLVSEQLSANKFVLDDRALSSFRAYTLQDLGDQKGEIAEQAIQRLMSPDMITMSGNPTDAIDLGYYRVGNAKSNDVKEVVNELATSVKTTGNAWNNSIEYRQFSGDVGDKRKAYSIKFDDRNIEGLIKKYSTEATKDAGKVSVLQKIKEEGLTVKTSEPIIGGLGLYGIIERFNQANGYITSPPYAAEKYYKYRVDKKSDGTYGLSSDSYYFVPDPITGNLHQKPLSGIEFPQGASFKAIKELLDGTIKSRIELAEAELKRNIQNSPKKITYEDVMRRFQGQ